MTRLIASAILLVAFAITVGATYEIVQRIREPKGHQTARPVDWGQTTGAEFVIETGLASGRNPAPTDLVRLDFVYRAQEMQSPTGVMFTRIWYGDVAGSTQDAYGCPYESAPAGCGINDFFYSVLNAMAIAGVPANVGNENFLRVLDAGRPPSCTLVTLVGTRYVWQFVRPWAARPTWLRLDLRTGHQVPIDLPSVATCHDETTIMQGLQGIGPLGIG